MNSYQDKCEQLKQNIARYREENVIVAFSGGVDSSLLLKLTCEANQSASRKVYAVTLQTMLHPSGDIEEARAIAEEIGAEHRIIKVDELEEAGIMNNPKNRCYLCKKCLFSKVILLAKELNAGVIIEGTNEDDLHVYRPGIQAVRELGLVSPLAEAHMTKADVRLLAEEYGLTAADKPSKPCLATRFPYGTPLSYEEMKRVEQGEAIVASYGFYNVRLRVHGELVRIEVDSDGMSRLLSCREQIVPKLKELGYKYITVDIEGLRSGSMDE